MKNTFVVDANIILRYLLADHAEHFRTAAEFMGRVKSGDVNLYVPEGVMIECVYVLLKCYKVPKEEIEDKLSGLLDYRGVINSNRRILLKALRLFREKNVDIVDAVVYAISKEHGWTCFLFDKDVKKNRIADSYTV
jgi:predicted nucleic-acid-binding protein